MMTLIFLSLMQTGNSHVYIGRTMAIGWSRSQKQIFACRNHLH